jgi:chorismate mutase
MICDPSHITGNSNHILEIAQKAMDMSYDGLMIETHIDPKNALSDKKQQITPAELEKILNKLVIRNFETDDKEFKATLKQLRIQIDDLDIELLRCVEKKNGFGSKKLVFIKKKTRLPYYKITDG